MPSTAVNADELVETLIFAFEIESLRVDSCWDLGDLGSTLTGVTGVIRRALATCGVPVEYLDFAERQRRALRDPRTYGVRRQRRSEVLKDADAMTERFGVTQRSALLEMVRDIEEQLPEGALLDFDWRGRTDGEDEATSDFLVFVLTVYENMLVAYRDDARLSPGEVRVLSVHCESPALVQVMVDVSTIAADPIAVKVFAASVAVTLAGVAAKGRGFVRGLQETWGQGKAGDLVNELVETEIRAEIDEAKVRQSEAFRQSVDNFVGAGLNAREAVAAALQLHFGSQLEVVERTALRLNAAVVSAATGAAQELSEATVRPVEILDHNGNSLLPNNVDDV